MRYWKKHEFQKRQRRWKGAAVLLLAVVLTACGGDQAGGSDTVPSGAVRLEDIGQTKPQNLVQRTVTMGEILQQP